MDLHRCHNYNGWLFWLTVLCAYYYTTVLYYLINTEMHTTSA